MWLVHVCYSENYIFGKFDTFTKRLEKIIKLVEIIDKSQGVENLRIEGIEEIVEQYKEIVDGLKKKNYDLLNFRRHEVLRYCYIITALLSTTFKLPITYMSIDVPL